MWVESTSRDASRGASKPVRVIAVEFIGLTSTQASSELEMVTLNDFMED